MEETKCIYTYIRVRSFINEGYVRFIESKAIVPSNGKIRVIVRSHKSNSKRGGGGGGEKKKGKINSLDLFPGKKRITKNKKA